MFGHQDNHSQQDADVASDITTGDMTDTDGGKADSANEQSWQHPGTPLDDATDSTSHDASTALDSDAVEDTASEDQSVVTPSDHTDTNSNDANDLIDIKQQALGQLSPLLGHLDQSPEEKFRTTMMMIQASDDKSLVRAAYETAKQIEDEKTRAQALLDVINEINYFTQQNDK